MSAGRGFGRAAASCEMNRRDFLLFRWRPRAGPSSLHNMEGSSKVSRGATKSAVIKVPSIDVEGGYLVLDPLHDGVQGQGESQWAQRVTLLHSTLAEKSPKWRIGCVP